MKLGIANSFALPDDLTPGIVDSSPVYREANKPGRMMLSYIPPESGVCLHTRANPPTISTDARIVPRSEDCV